MELYLEILLNLLQKEEAQITFPNLQMDVESIVLDTSYRALQAIKRVLTDDSLSDAECFRKIEEIVQILEGIGSSGGNRHDWG